MHADIERLIKLSIADGVITEKEREVIMRKAESLGEDKDEVELILDGELALKDEQKPKPQDQNTSNKEGIIKKCPSCGAPVPSLKLKCEDCGHEFRSTESNQSIKEFFEQIKSAKINNKSSIISNFPVPNNKEDLIEFITLSVGNSRELTDEERVTYLKNALTGSYKPELSYRESEIKAWQSKAEAGIMKAKLLFSDNPTLIKHIREFEKQFMENKNYGTKARQKRILLVFGFMLIGLIILYFIIKF